MADTQIEPQENETFLSRFLQPGWKSALFWGISTALIHRLLLGLWVAGVWLMMGQFLEEANVNFHDPGNDLPALTTETEGLAFGVWRRWDAVHYLNLAAYGYRPSYPGPTVFGALTPAGFRLFDLILPGGLDLGAMVFQTVMFALALTLLYRVVEVYYGDVELAPWAVAIMALIPYSYVFATPLSETVYLALTLGVFFFAAKQRWLWAALFGFLATLARSQGVFLLGIAGLIMFEQVWRDDQPWLHRIRGMVQRGWVLAIIPLGAVGFVIWRQQLGLPPATDIYATSSYVFFVDPIRGLILNLRYIVDDIPRALTQFDLIAIPVNYGLAVAMIFFKKHRRLALLAYTFGYLLVFGSKMNWQWGSDVVTYTQSFARYAVVLFPLAVLIADGLRHSGFLARVIGVGLLLISVLGFSGLHVLALAGP
jgi:hypothetical protein